MQISAQHQFLPKTNSVRASMVMDNFGIDFEQGSHVIADEIDLPIEQGQIVAFTGESGSGKSTLMRTVRSELTEQGQTTISLDEVSLGEKILVDSIELPFEETLQILSACGLGEAHLLLRTPQELSDGQRYRFQLAKAFSTKVDWIIADEYTATLDRTLAKVVSLNLQKLNVRTNSGILVATTHEDIIDDLAPHLQVRCFMNGSIELIQAVDADRKKKDSRWQTNSGSHRPPKPTGRTSLGGIIAATKSASSVS
ncbi:MAG: ATP-binding cassette domain-containing protein [Planctomicrobium sp.]|jgi:uncharacterized protein|nr:ATP-binding cassette domain-containing protein [Planctomicrobium sp.]